MSHQFKQGDLAMTLVSLKVLPAGSIVQLDKAINPGDNIWTKRAPLIAIGKGWFCSHSEVGDRLPFAEKNLMPLRGDFVPEQHKAREAEPCA